MQGRHGLAGPGRAGQGLVGPGEARRDRAGQGGAGQGRVGLERARQGQETTARIECLLNSWRIREIVLCV